MRCIKCGYDNIGRDTCVKCGTPIKAQGSEVGNQPNNIGKVVDMDLRATRIGGIPNEINQLKSTVIQGSGNYMGADSPRPTVIENGIGTNNVEAKATRIQSVSPEHHGSEGHSIVGDDLKCPNCGYPVTDKFACCPNCGKDFSGEEEIIEEEAMTPQHTPSNQSFGGRTIGIQDLNKDNDNVVVSTTCDSCQKEIPAEYSFCPHCGAKIMPKTIQVLQHKDRKKKEEKEQQSAEQQKPVDMHCSLTLVLEDDEQKDAATNQYEGPVVLLNRNNTESDNYTITSKEQAVLSFEDGKWYLENRSKFKSTLLVAGRKVELISGDLIMLGDRRFEFKVPSADE